MSDLQARLRIFAETTQATKAIRDVDKALAETGKQSTAAQRRAGDEAERTQRRAEVARRREQRLQDDDERRATARAERRAEREKEIADRAAKKAAGTPTRNAALLAPQLTDIVTSLQGGQNPLTVLLQQGGQLRDLFGGFKPLFATLAQVFTPVRIAAAGLLTVLGGVALAIGQGVLESDRLAKANALSGNQFGISAGMVDEYTTAVQRATGVSQGAAREAALLVASSGQFAAGTAGSVAKAITAINRLTGDSAEETLKQFTALVDGTSAGAAKLNRQYSFLTAEQFKLIKQLEAQGRSQEAIKLITEQLTSVITGRTVPAIGALEGAWTKVTNVLSDVWSWLKKIGSDTSAEEQLRQVELRLEKLKSASGLGGASTPEEIGYGASYNKEIAELEAKRDQLQLLQKEGYQAAQRQREENKKIEQLSEKHQGSLSQIAEAGAQRTLAIALRGIEARASAVERDHAAGLTSERAYTERLNGLELERLRAQEAAAKARIAIAGKELVKGGDSAEQNAIRARVTTLNAALIEVQTKIAQQQSKALADTDRANLAESREDAQQWANIWSQAFERVRDLALDIRAAQNARIADPLKAAQASAAAAVSDLRRQQAALERDLQNRIDQTTNPEQRGLLEQQLEQLRRSTEIVAAERGREAQYRTLIERSAQASAVYQAQEAQITAQLNAGLLTSAEAEQQILALRRQQLPELERILELLSKIAETPEEKATVQGLRSQVTAARDLRTEYEKFARSQAVDSFSQALNDWTIKGASFWTAMRDGVRSFAQSMLELINRRLAEKLVQQFIDAGNSGGNGNGGWLAALFQLLGSAGSSATRGTSVGGGLATGSPSAGADFSIGTYADGRVGNGALAPKYAGSSFATSTKANAGDVTINVPVDVTVQGGQAQSGAPQRDGTEQLRRMIEGVVQDWAVNQQRSGGMLSRA
jgi:phage-related minor tail protein